MRSGFEADAIAQAARRQLSLLAQQERQGKITSCTGTFSRWSACGLWAAST
jgi:hypothetical protein